MDTNMATTVAATTPTVQRKNKHIATNPEQAPHRGACIVINLKILQFWAHQQTIPNYNKKGECLHIRLMGG